MPSGCVVLNMVLSAQSVALVGGKGKFHSWLTSFLVTLTYLCCDLSVEPAAPAPPPVIRATCIELGEEHGFKNIERRGTLGTEPHVEREAGL